MDAEEQDWVDGARRRIAALLGSSDTVAIVACLEGCRDNSAGGGRGPSHPALAAELGALEQRLRELRGDGAQLPLSRAASQQLRRQALQEPEPEPEPEPQRRAETPEEAGARKRIKALDGVLADLAQTSGKPKGKGGKKAKRGKGGGAAGQQQQPHQRWLETARAIQALDVRAAAAAGAAADEVGRTEGLRPLQPAWATAWFMLLQRLHQSGPLAGSKPGQFCRHEPLPHLAAAAVACVEAATAADGAAGGRLLTETQRQALGKWRADAEKYLRGRGGAAD